MKHSSEDRQGKHSAPGMSIRHKKALEYADNLYGENAKEYGVKVAELPGKILSSFLSRCKMPQPFKEQFVVHCKEDDIEGTKALIIAIMAVMSDSKRGKWKAYLMEDPFHAQQTIFLHKGSWDTNTWLRCHSQIREYDGFRTQYALLCFEDDYFEMKGVARVSLELMCEWAEKIFIDKRCDLKKPQDIMHMLEVKEFDVNTMYATQLRKLEAEVENIQNAKDAEAEKAQLAAAKKAAAKKAQRAKDAEAAKKRQLDKDAADEAAKKRQLDKAKTDKGTPAKKPKLEEDAGASPKDTMEEFQKLVEQIKDHRDKTLHRQSLDAHSSQR